MPWTFGEAPDDPAWISECRASIKHEFLEFLRQWRALAQETLNKLSPPLS